MPILVNNLFHDGLNAIAQKEWQAASEKFPIVIEYLKNLDSNTLDDHDWEVLYRSFYSLNWSYIHLDRLQDALNWFHSFMEQLSTLGTRKLSNQCSIADLDMLPHGISELLTQKLAPLDLVIRFSDDLERMQQLFNYSAVFIQKIKFNILDHLHTMCSAHLLNRDYVDALIYFNTSMKIFSDGFKNADIQENKALLYYLCVFSIQAEKFAACPSKDLQTAFQENKIALDIMLNRFAPGKKEMIANNSTLRLSAELSYDASRLFKSIYKSADQQSDYAHEQSRVSIT